MGKTRSFVVEIVTIATAVASAAIAWHYGQEMSDPTSLQKFGNSATAVAAVMGFVGVVVLVVYTRETYLLRVTAQEQNENAVKPILLFILSSTLLRLGVLCDLRTPH